jgi:glutaredoxin
LLQRDARPAVFVTTSAWRWHKQMAVAVERIREQSNRRNTMRFFGFGKKRDRERARPPVTPSGHEEHHPHAPASRDIVVYGTSDGVRCRQVRELLEKRANTYEDVRVDEDLSTRSWLQRTTGDDALPKVFIGPKCYGGLEDIQVLVFDGRFDRILRGEADQDTTSDEMVALKGEMNAGTLGALLRRGEILTITEGEMATDVWAEPLANPPLVYYEGTPHPIGELESIVEQILTRLHAGDIAVRWKEDT